MARVAARHEATTVYAEVDYKQVGGRFGGVGVGVWGWGSGMVAGWGEASNSNAQTCLRFCKPVRLIRRNEQNTQVEERRTNMPLTQQRRGDLYEVVDKSAA